MGRRRRVIAPLGYSASRVSGVRGQNKSARCCRTDPDDGQGRPARGQRRGDVWVNMRANKQGRSPSLLNMADVSGEQEAELSGLMKRRFRCQSPFRPRRYFAFLSGEPVKGPADDGERKAALVVQPAFSYTVYQASLPLLLIEIC
ncbi:hypothetical protein BaRGS_00008128 [Batillaria attramentaria]|uniref:Uncharacterized protein n=1 Tax=Batillaria attramentaria TaxID=370345 RepID=A0ABD0LNI8_9CAEN